MRTISASDETTGHFEAGAGMRRRRRVTRFLIRGFATAAIGGFIGFLVPTVIADLTPKPEVVETAVAESPLARTFINAFTADDQSALTSLGVSADVKLRATRFRADFARVDPPVHLGSFLAGGFTLHAYAAHAVQGDGVEVTLGWRVATGGGEIILITPPGQIEEP
jgi:hypothetical protein